jgi:hypothetical protein
LFRRVKLGWSGDMGVKIANDSARAVADLLGWDDSDIESEVERYRRDVREQFLVADLTDTS